MRPLNLGDIYDGAISAMRLNPGSMIGLPAALGLISVVIMLAGMMPLTTITSMDSGTSVSLAILAMVAGLVTWVLNTLVTGALTIAVGQGVFDRKTSAGELLRAAREHLGRLLLLSLLGALVGAVGGAAVILILVAIGSTVPWLLILLIPAALVALAWLYVRISMCASALVLERIGPLDAVRRSWRLTARGFWRLFGILAVTLLIMWVLSVIINLPISLFASFAGMIASVGSGPADSGLAGVLSLMLGSVGNLLAQALIAPFMAGVVTLLYLDARMRQEGLDVQLVQEAQAQPGQRAPGTGWS